MSQNFLIGLGGSGGKVISELYRRLREEKGNDYVLNNVQCIAIDTDQVELNKLAELGVSKVRISGEETVGQMVNHLGGDVTDWCPDTANEGVFYSDPVHNGASQCRLKSRLCLANYLKNDNNSLKLAIEKSRLTSAASKSTDDDLPTVLIVSSIAGGTGSGIFIQVALYIKKLFREFDMNIKVHGLFACPDLYENVVTRQQLPSLYANAYAVIRELNAFNTICAGDSVSVYDGEVGADIEISSQCEGKLFEKNSEGRYGNKPYDIMYFISKINCFSRTLGNLDSYYSAMADIAYSHLYTDISGKVLSNESNEMNTHSKIPTAIYGSAGAASLSYPYDDILKYFACRSIGETVSTIWATLDKQWYTYLQTKNAEVRSLGYNKYTPKPGERAAEYIRNFEEKVNTRGISYNDMSFLAPMVKKDDVCAAESLLNAIVEAASAETGNDDRIANAKEVYGIANIGETYSSVCEGVDDFTNIDDDSDIFSAIKDIDDTLELYCKKGLSYAIESSYTFADKIYCDNKEFWDNYDRNNMSVSLIHNLFYNHDMKEWVHPIAARYLLYKFSGLIKNKTHELIGGFNTPAEDADDFYSYLETEYVEAQKNILSTNEDEFAPNAQLLEDMIVKPFRKRATKKKVGEYFENLETQIEQIDEVFSNALTYFALIRVQARVEKLIEAYENFFDNLDDFIDKAVSETSQLKNKHDLSTTDVYVCAGADVKEYLYEEFGRKLNAQDGKTASLINMALFNSMRIKAAEDMKNTAVKSGRIGKKTVYNNVFETVLNIVVEDSKNDIEIKENLDLNVFDAMMLEYKLLNPDNADDEQNYLDQNDKGPQTRINAYLANKFTALARCAAPCLLFDCEDQYRTILDKNNIVEADKVTNTYRYFSQNKEVCQAIQKKVGGTGSIGSAVADLYRTLSPDLPKDTDSQTITINSVESESVDKYTLLCYSTAHCLQPYQIPAFDELKGGKYFEHYARRIIEMESLQKYSLSPHLDKRWHKHGVMPYINAKKEKDYKTDVIRAFLYAVANGMIGYNLEGSYARFVYSDMTLGRMPELMFCDGKPISYRKVNQAVAWLADNDDLVDIYSHRYEQDIQADLDRVNRYSETVGGYKTGITNYATLLRQMKRNIFRAVELRASRNGRAKKVQTKDNISILELAWLLHVSEESEIDKNYGELVIEVLCDTIKEYAKAPYNARKIEMQDTSSEAYTNYLDVCSHIAQSFINVFEGPSSTPKKAKVKAFNISDEDKKPIGSVENDKSGNIRLMWATAEMAKHIKLTD